MIGKFSCHGVTHDKNNLLLLSATIFTFIRKPAIIGDSLRKKEAGQPSIPYPLIPS